MGRSIIETVMGAIVLIIAAGFLITAYKGRSINQVENGLHVNAEFDNVSGIAVGSDVRMGGVKIGVVDRLSLNPQNYRAKIEMLLDKDVPYPSDSSAAITSDGLLGGKFVSLEPGSEEAMLNDGGKIQFTQSSVSLEQLIGKFIFSGAEDKDEGAKTAPAAQQDQPQGNTGSELDR